VGLRHPLLLCCGAALIAGLFALPAAADHDPTHFYSGKWTITANTPIGSRTGTMTFKAATPAQGEAALQAMGISKWQGNQYCPSNQPGQYYVGTYNGGIGEGYSLSSSNVPAPPDGTFAGCIDGFGQGFVGWFKNSDSRFIPGRLSYLQAGTGFQGNWMYGDFGQSFTMTGVFDSHVPGDGAVSDPDSDGDGLPDSWETEGYDANDDGTVDVPLPQMGADPNHKDVFVQLDMMFGHTLQQAPIQKVINAFANAPVSNPDGKPGIALHVDGGPGWVMNPKTGAKWGELSKAGTTAEKPVLGSYSILGNYKWADFDAIKAKNFPAARARIFHYVVVANRYGNDSEKSTGLSRAAPGNDFIIALGGTCGNKLDCPGTPEEQAGTFMHELGHNLGLRHGGNEETNYKPDYLSVMNYSFQLGGLSVGGGTSFDYSRLGPTQIGPLDESALKEGDGFGPAAIGLSYTSLFFCPGADTAGDPDQPADVQKPVDWNCNKNIDSGSLALDVNGDRKKTVLQSYNDWTHLVFKDGAIGSKGELPAQPAETPGGDAPIDKLIAAAGALFGDTKAPTAAIAGKRVLHRRGKVRVNVRDDKGLSQLIVVVGKKTYSFNANGAKSGFGTVKLVRPGTYVIKGAAVDRVGHFSKTAQRTVRVLPR
jgi:hypothetical protein